MKSTRHIVLLVPFLFSLVVGCSSNAPKAQDENDIIAITEGLFSGERRGENQNTVQAYKSDLVEAATTLRVLLALESDDIKTTKRMLRTKLAITVAFLPVFEREEEIPPHLRKKGRVFARSFLQYLLNNEAALEGDLRSMRLGFQGLSLLLETPSERAKLEGLARRLGVSLEPEPLMEMLLERAGKKKE